jgi:uncharacterized protein YaaN involved in tellurite resistance
MSELDLGSTSATPTATPSAGVLVLAPPAPVVLVEKEQAAGAVPLPEGKQAELRTKADQFVDGLIALDMHSPEFAQKVSQITTMGDTDMRAAAAMSNRMLDRPAAAMGKAKDKVGADAQTRVSNTLVDLRRTVTDLDPNRADLTGVKKALKWLPGGDKIDRYFDKYRTAQSHIDDIIKALASGQDELRKDNAAIETEKANMWTTMGKISEYNELSGALDAAVRIAVIVSQALSRQKLVLDQINALNTVTSNLIESTSEQLKRQGTAINQQAASATVDVAKLQAAFDNVFATMDAVDTFRAQAVDSMAQTVTALEGQIERAKPYLERTRRGELAGT